ncbi:MAG: sigma-70 family RNA polymerase sigma factor [bacterium]|nr:sigma-70 family RNA polymerase sigma factor [bacterium]
MSTSTQGGPASGWAVDFPRWLDAARRGQRRAQEELFCRYYLRVERVAHARLRRALGEQRGALAARFSTADVVQEVFLCLLQNLREFRGSTEGEFVAFVARLVRCRALDVVRHHAASCRDFHRGEGSVEVDELGTRGPAPLGATPEDEEFLERYVGALGALPPRTQRLLRARLELGMSFQDIAERLGYSSRYAVRRAFFAAKSQLTLRLGPDQLAPGR